MNLKNCCDERTKNLVVASFCMSLCMFAGAPAGTVQNIALAESTDIDLSVGYHSEVVKTVAGIVAAIIFHPVHNLIGIKVTALLSTVLVTGNYWVMVWIVNKYMLYFGAALCGMGWGALWVLWPMVVVENSAEKKSQKNMGYWFMSMSIGTLMGGLANYFYFEGVTKISSKNRVMLYTTCAGVTMLTSLVAAFGITDIKKSPKRHQPLTDEDIETVPQDDLDEVTYSTKGGEADVNVMIPRKPSGVNKVKDWFKVMTKKAGLKEGLDWFKVMARIPAFWFLVIPLIYWGFIWGYFIKILPTATASISDKRNLIPLTSVINGVCSLVGTTTWNLLSKITNNIFCIMVASAMLLSSLILSILIFPKGAASEILALGSAETYITPDPIHVVVICALIGLADSGVSIIYFSTAGRIYGDEPALGYATNAIGYYVFYICSMFSPSLFDLHTYCYCMIASVVAMCLVFPFGLRKYLDNIE
ncbi:uncharacterized protein LOC134817212 [Bolinopsis microptera]|uniref:uncharacterized protein LOC134817212 n=1 Tax=Bolinopsis microptera TaxID=2820187 RepID=UPI00307B0612